MARLLQAHPAGLINSIGSFSRSGDHFLKVAVVVEVEVEVEVVVVVVVPAQHHFYYND